MWPKTTFLRHTREGGYPDPSNRFSPCRWIPAFAGMTGGGSYLIAESQAKAQVELSKNGLHWDALDEGISVA